MVVWVILYDYDLFVLRLLAARLKGAFRSYPLEVVGISSIT